MSVHDAAILRRLERIEAMLAQLVGLIDEPAVIDPMPMIAELTGGDWFTASELWQSVEALRAAAEATGEPTPDVAQAFSGLSITSVKSLGRWLSGRSAEVIERTERTRAGVLWRVVTLAG
ncbi:hypothetical protein FA743_10970 [Paracoccus gahaiensis]|uniref:Uncharacterized protein n=1 Tax=Paracoccus gahaiensis TaxID=1706839 RepID=A0A4U0RAV8_9RHOB|nr:hypothetical protein [Paracoccus gahaiensis]TJZ91610.1 hypothetical protein FA743_10970 [Paracoccus gahaiensis]